MPRADIIQLKISKRSAFTLIPVLFAFCLFLFLILSFRSYCSKPANNNNCLRLSAIAVPNDAPSQYMGSFMGAVLTFTAFYLLELLKDEMKPRARLSLGFSLNDLNELIVCSEPHNVRRPKQQDHIAIRTATYLRVKVTNIGDKMASGCTGVLKSILVKKGQEEFTVPPNWDGPMNLLWPYERHQDHRSASTAFIPAGASDFLDILVSYDNFLKPYDLIPSNIDGDWFLKLKTQPQASKHRKLLSIKKGETVSYFITVEVYADGSKPALLTLELRYPGTNEILVYPQNASRNDYEDKQFKISLHSPDPHDDSSSRVLEILRSLSQRERDELYDLL